MAETESGSAEVVPTITQGQTTAVGEGTQVEQQVLEGEASERGSRGFDVSTIFIWVLAGLWIWYLFGSKSRRKAREKQKQERERKASLQKGDKVVTIGGMHGSVVAFTEGTVTIKPDPKSDYTMTFERQALHRILPRPGEEVDQVQTDQEQR